MRRLVVTVGVLVMCLGLFPSRADAFWWDWLDDMSGPEFKGYLVEWKVWCRVSADGATPAGIRALHDKIQTRLAAYVSAREASTAGKPEYPFYEKAIELAEEARTAADEALVAYTATPRQPHEEDLREAISGLSKAQDYFKWAERVAHGASPDGPGKPGGTVHTDSVVPLPGFTLSFCGAEATHNAKSFLAIRTGWGQNVNTDFDASRLRMVQLGATYHRVMTSYLTIGAGAGVAIFSSADQPTFQKLYVEPVLVDLRSPRGPRLLRSFSFRLGAVMFPTGIEEHRFGGTSPRFPNEWIPGYGINFDLDTLLYK